MKTKNQRLTEVLFFIYLLALVWIIVFKMEFSFADINEMQTLNLDPYSAPARINGVVVYEEIYFNILAFVPFGLYLGILFKKWNIYQNILVFLFVSLSFEMIQYIFSIGATDVINNVFGGIVGVIIFRLLNLFMKNSHRAHKLINIFAAVGTVLVVIVLFILKIT